MGIYFNDSVKFKAIAVLDGFYSPYDLYRKSQYLTEIDLTDKYGRTNDVVLNSYLLRKFLEEEDLSKVLILLTDRTINSTDFLREISEQNYIFLLAKNPKLQSDVNNLHLQRVPSTCDDNLFKNRAGTHLKKILEGQFEGLNEHQSFPEKKEDIKKLEDVLSIQSNRFESNLEKNGFKFSFLCNLKRWTKRLVIINQSAIDITKQRPPVYQRWKWADDFNATTIVLNDPMLYLGSDLNGGWWIGTRDVDLIDLFINEVKRLAKKLDVSSDNVFFYGGSAGGFTSLQMAASYPNSTAIVDIPQTDLTRYAQRNQIKRAFEAGFGAGTFENQRDSHLDRLSVISRIKKNKFGFKLIFLQNTNDTHHVRTHFIPLINYLKKINIVKYKCFGYDLMHPTRGGHFPLGRYETTFVVNRTLELSKAGILPENFNEIGLNVIRF